MLPRHHRLRRPSEFSAVLRGARAGQGGPAASTRPRRAGHDLLVVHLRREQSTGRPPRAGLAVSRAVGNAVVRHRVSRRLRALLAARLTRLPSGTDLVVRANPPAATATSAELAAALDACLTRLGHPGERGLG